MCGGTGRTEGIAAEVFRRHPITRVTLAGMVDCLGGWEGSYFWRDDAVFDHEPRLPARICPKGSYSTPAAAVTALSTACVRYGRNLVGLPPLQESNP